MTISTGSKITAVDYNGLVENTNKIFADNYSSSTPSTDPTEQAARAFGWGNANATLVTMGTKITASLVNQVVDKLNISAEHTGSEYVLDQVIPGQKITAQIWQDIQTVLNDVAPNKNTAAIGQTTISQLGFIEHSAGFGPALTYTVALTFDSFNQARYFFNSGSTIKLSLGKDGGNAAADSWGSVYTRFGTVNFSLSNTLSTTYNIISENLGFEDLTTGDQLLLTCNGLGGGGYGYGSYGYGSGGYGYGSGGYGYGSGGYGYGSGGSNKHIRVYGRLTSSTGDFHTGPVVITLTVALTSSETDVTGTHTLYVDSNKATNKTNGAETFSIVGPNYAGSASI
jgi:hypothetical protein